MAAFNAFNSFTKDLIDGAFDFDNHTFKVMLTNVAPVAANSVKADLTEIAAGNGYTAGGLTTVVTTSTLAGVAKATGSDVTFTAAGGTMASFRYVVIYDDTQTSPAKPLVAWWDYGQSVSLTSGDSFYVDFSAVNGIFQVQVV